MNKINAQRYIRWKDALDHYNRLLDDAVKEAKPIGTAYTKYLKENPYKKRKKELAEQKAKHTARIIKLTKQGYEKYDGK